MSPKHQKNPFNGFTKALDLGHPRSKGLYLCQDYDSKKNWEAKTRILDSPPPHDYPSTFHCVMVALILTLMPLGKLALPPKQHEVVVLLPVLE